MSSIDELIARLAPDGVEYRALGELGELIRGRRFTKADYVDDGLESIHYGEIYTTYGLSATETVSRVRPELRNQLRLANPGDLVIAATGENADEVGKAVAWLGEGPVAVHDDCYIFRHTLNPKFVAHCFQATTFHDQKSRYVSEAKLSRVSGRDLAKIRIPVPPREVQAAIVRILDQFVELEVELEAELEAELGARRLQYALARERILIPGPDWRTTTVGELAEVFDGPHATPKKTLEGPWYLSISSLKSGSVDLSVSAHLADSDLQAWTRRVAPRPGDTLFSYETRIGQAGYWDRAEPAALGRRMGVLRPRTSAVVPRFLTIAYLSPEFQALIESKTVRGSTVDRISIADLPSWPISVPSIDEQRRIIGLLESFDVLVSDLTSGLPAEIAARRQQYEYYRDRLLTFEEVPA